jgi:hypothetical protein
VAEVINKALYYGMENPMVSDPPCTNPHTFSQEVWNAWNTAGGEERIKYIEHAELLVNRGYLELTEGRNLMDVAMSVFSARFEEAKKKAALEKASAEKDK